MAGYIHNDYTFDQFKELLLNNSLEEDKIYFIKDVDSNVQMIQELIVELKEQIQILQNLLRTNEEEGS